MRHQEQFPGQAIAGLRTRLLVMSAAVGIALDESFRALDERSPARAAAVIDGDNVIDDLEDEIDEQALCLLARTQPVACDLRFVVGALRMVADLERIGDEAVSIAEQAILLQDLGQRPEMPEELRQILQRMSCPWDDVELSAETPDNTTAETEAADMSGVMSDNAPETVAPPLTEAAEAASLSEPASQEPPATH